jgi:DNA polymerase V
MGLATIVTVNNKNNNSRECEFFYSPSPANEATHVIHSEEPNLIPSERPKPPAKGVGGRDLSAYKEMPNGLPYGHDGDDHRSIRNFKSYPLGHATCGLFGISQDYLERYLSLDERFIKNKASTYFFEVENDSMSPLIVPGDILIVDRAETCRNNSIVVASLSGEFVCKRFIKRGDELILSSENGRYGDIYITEEMELVVFGVVTSLVRPFRD